MRKITIILPIVLLVVISLSLIYAQESEDSAGMSDSSITEGGEGDPSEGEGLGQETEGIEIVLVLDDDKIIQGDELKASILISGENDITTRLIIQIVKACPDAVCDVEYEETIDNIHIIAFEPKAFDFMHKINLSPGYYFLTVRLENANLLEIEEMEGSGAEQSQQFEVIELSAKIIKWNSYLLDPAYKGFLTKPIIKADSDVEGSIFVHNYGSKKLDNLILHIGVCELEYLLCTDKFLLEKEYSFSISSLAGKSVNINFKSPSKKDGYNIRFTLKDNEQVFSTFTSQFIVVENLIGIRSIIFNDEDAILSKGEQGKIEVKVGGLYQGVEEYTIENAELSVYLKDTTGNLIYETSTLLPSLSSNPKNLITKTFYFSSPSLLTSYEICAVLTKDEEILDEKCLSQDNTLLIGENRFLVSTSYEQETSNLKITISVLDKENQPAEVNLLVQLFDEDTSSLLFSEREKANIFSFTTSAELDKEYMLIINDLDSHRQLQYPFFVECKNLLDSCCSGLEDDICDPDCRIDSDPDCSKCSKECGEDNKCNNECSKDIYCPNDPDCGIVKLVELTPDNIISECTTEEGDCCYPIYDGVCDGDCKNNDPDCIERCESCWNNGICTQSECEELGCQKCDIGSCSPVCNGTTSLRARVVEMLQKGLSYDMDNDGIPNSLDDDGDGDGILNILDEDDDNDGFSDKVELRRGTSPIDPLSKPQSRKRVYLMYSIYSVIAMGLLIGVYYGFRVIRRRKIRPKQPSFSYSPRTYQSQKGQKYPFKKTTARMQEGNRPIKKRENMFEKFKIK